MELSLQLFVAEVSPKLMLGAGGLEYAFSRSEWCRDKLRMVIFVEEVTARWDRSCYGMGTALELIDHIKLCGR